MRVFLAGATAAVGKRLVPLLVASGHHIVATTRTPDKLTWLPDLARAIGAKPPYRQPAWVGDW